MKEPTRLMHDGSPRAKELLASLDEDVPPDPIGAQERLLRALDLDPNGAVEPRDRPRGPRRSWLALAVTGGLFIGSVAAFGVSPGEDELAGTETPAPRPETTAAPTVEARVEAPPAPAPADEATVDVHALAAAVPENRGRQHAAPRIITRKDVREAAPASTAKPATTTDGTDELAILERAQRAASQGLPDEALALVERHRREFPRGRFGIEMSVVEIEALARAGRLGDAAARGETFLQRHPGSPYTRRVEAVVRAKNQKEETR